MEKSDSEETRYFMDLDKQFHEICKNEDILKRTTEKFFNNLLDNITLGIIFDVHRSYKIGTFDLEAEKTEAELKIEATSDSDVFGQQNMKIQDCLCPNCDREVTAIRFAPHLEVCMGMKKLRSRKASRRIANNSKERENISYGGVISDDDDIDWASGDKRRKKKDRNNGVKRGKGTPKKTNDVETVDSLNVDVEGDEEGTVSNFQILLQDHSNSNGSSPVDSNSSNSSKKRDKPSKSKKSSKKDRGSLNINLLME